jgi:hypothetical protein
MDRSLTQAMQCRRRMAFTPCATSARSRGDLTSAHGLAGAGMVRQSQPARFVPLHGVPHNTSVRSSFR